MLEDLVHGTVLEKVVRYLLCVDQSRGTLSQLWEEKMSEELLAPVQKTNTK